MKFRYKMVFVVREDLDLSKGKLAVQVAHAAVELVLKADKKTVEEWIEEGAKKVVLKCKNLEELLYLYDKAKALNLNVVLIRDAGLTEVPPGTITCMGIGPDREDVIDKVTGSLKLLR